MPGDHVRFHLTVPDGSTVDSIRARINPAEDALPTTNFSLALWKKQKTTGAPTSPTLVDSVVDPLTGASYQAEHDLTLSSIGEVVDNTTYIYWIGCHGEDTGDADNVVLRDLEITYSRDNAHMGG